MSSYFYFFCVDTCLKTNSLYIEDLMKFFLSHSPPPFSVLGSYPARQHTTRPTPLNLFKCCFVGVSLCWGLPTATHEKAKHEAAHFTFIHQTRLTWINPTCALGLLGSQSRQWGQATALSEDLPGRMRTKGEWERKENCNSKCWIKYSAEGD